MQARHRHWFAAAVMLLIAPLAHAHPLTAHGAVWQAFVHPFTGLDHVLAMVVIGLWAGMAATGRRLLPPLGFIAGLLAGAVLGTLGVALPAVEIGIALSVSLLGPLAAREAQLPAVLCLALCACAGLCHGYAHGIDLNGQGLASAGFVLGSVALHGLGYAYARHISARGQLAVLRGALSASGLLGLGLLWLA